MIILSGCAGFKKKEMQMSRLTVAERQAAFLIIHERESLTVN